MQRAETINSFAVWQRLSTGSPPGSAPLAGEGSLSSPRQPESLGGMAPLQGGPSPDQASGGTSPPSPEADYPPCQPQTSPGRPPQTVSLLMSVLSPGTQEHFQSLNWSVICWRLFLSMICHLISWSWRKHKALSSEASVSQGRHPALNHWPRFPLLLPQHPHLPQRSHPASPRLFSEPSPAAQTSTNHHPRTIQ